MKGHKMTNQNELMMSNTWKDILSVVKRKEIQACLGLSRKTVSKYIIRNNFPSKHFPKLAKLLKPHVKTRKNLIELFYEVNDSN